MSDKLLNTIVRESPFGIPLAIEIIREEMDVFEWEAKSGELDFEEESKRYKQIKSLEYVIKILEDFPF